MTAAEIVRGAAADGVHLTVCDDGRIVIQGRETPARRWYQAVAVRRTEVAAVLLGEQNTTIAADSVLAPQELVAPCTSPPMPPVCGFLIGHPGQDCLQCGASWIEHYPPTSEGA